MKKLTLTLFLALICTVGFAQVFRIDSLPKQGILLDKGWKWHAGDNPDFAKVDFDDSNWESIDPTKDIFDLPQLKKDGSIFWLRIKLNIDTTITRQLVLQLNQSGASEIYLNGMLLQTFGIIRKNPSEITAFTPNLKPFSFPITDEKEQVLVVRYAFEPNISYGRHFGQTNKVIDATISSTNYGWDKFEFIVNGDRDTNLYVASFGILFLFFITFFLFFPNRKVSLYFAINAFLAAYTWSLFYKIHQPVEVRDIYLKLNTLLVGQSIAYVLQLLSIYEVFEQKRGVIFWFIATLGVIACFTGTYIYSWGWLVFGLILSTTINVDIMRVTIVAVRKKKQGGWILLVGGLIYLICWIFFQISFNGVFTIDNYLPFTIPFFLISILSIPIAFAIYFGYDFGITNTILRQKLKENAALAEEKQYILTTQNETLEKQVTERTAELVHKNRDLEIEAALDKVRSRSLAMQKSVELQEVVIVVFEKLKELGLVFDGGAGIQLFTEGSKNSTLWVAAPSQITSPSQINLPYDADGFRDNPIILDVWTAKETGEAIYNKTYTRDEKNRYFEYVFKHNDLIQVPLVVRDEIMQAPSYTQAFVTEKNSGVIANSWSNEVFPPDKFDVFKRIAKVFDQAYTRFLDLQKAEAQAEQAKLDLILIQTEKKRAEDALTELRSTQTQLIQSEKLASLGELTAGIAHEIQNPLNFVNNFSEMSVELAKELDEEIDKEVIDKDLVKDLVSDLTQNQQKINHHGKRASSIVSGMLEHSRASTGERVLTDINKLADEYLRLSYHGIRAKDNSFNCDYKTDFDENLPKIEVIPQDMGRVLLNLINNAFWATNQRNLQGFKNLTGLNDYNPTVTISTQQAAGRYAAAGELHNQVIIKVTDNGTGMTEDVKAKIFQPFFTTKPTGQGTGLGLSLAYDIVTKGHGGTIEVESVEGEGTTFIIKLLI